MLFGRHPPTQQTRPVEWALFDVKPDQHGLPKARATNNPQPQMVSDIVAGLATTGPGLQNSPGPTSTAPRRGDQLELELEFIM